ncbi:MAG: tandem-95 repeat protein [Candidatus Nealsonbacteria bacterium]|nr:tandem-95 repeat protein [Candidatus Nealsonbacteria bacterium]
MEASAIAADSDGNFFLSGTFYGTADVDPGPASTYLTSTGGCDSFVVKLDPGCNYLNSWQMGGSGGHLFATAIATDSAGNAYVGGIFSGSAIFPDGSVTSVGDLDGFVMKLGNATVHRVDAQPDAYNVDEDQTLDVPLPGVLNNDSDNEGHGLTARKTAGPSHGQLTVRPDGSFTYEPEEDFHGTDSFTYRAGDGTLDSDQTTVTITVHPVNDAPSAVDDAYTTDGGSALMPTAPGLLGNDEDVEDDSLTVIIVTEPEHDLAFQLNSDGSFAYFPEADYRGPDSFTYKVNDGELDSLPATVSITVGTPFTAIAGRHVFYNNSTFDVPLFGLTDDDAVAVDKQALLPGDPTSVATSANYTSYSRGINGLMVDIDGLPAGVTPTAADFEFRVGNDNQPGGWTELTVDPTVTLRRGDGDDGSERITIVVPDGAVRNTWLEVTVKAANLGMAGDDVFYFGNAVAEACNSDSDVRVTVVDLLLARNNPRSLMSSPADLTFAYDYDRDREVNATDVLLARNNRTSFLDELKLIDLTGGEEAQGASLAELAWLSEFDQAAVYQRPAEKDAAAEAVDQLLATFWR